MFIALRFKRCNVNISWSGFFFGTVHMCRQILLKYKGFKADYIFLSSGSILGLFAVSGLHLAPTPALNLWKLHWKQHNVISEI